MSKKAQISGAIVFLLFLLGGGLAFTFLTSAIISMLKIPLTILAGIIVLVESYTFLKESKLNIGGKVSLLASSLLAILIMIVLYRLSFFLISVLCFLAFGLYQLLIKRLKVKEKEIEPWDMIQNELK